MTAPTLDSLIVPLTVAEAKAAIYAALAAQGVTTTAWLPGSTARTIIAGLAIVLAAFSRLQSLIAKSGFLAYAEGDWLTLVARLVYGVERDVGTFAAGFITLTNSAGGSFSGDAGDLVFSSSVAKKTYRSTAAYTLGSMGTTTVAIEALEIGAASTAIAGDIDTMTTTLSGVTCSNAAALVGMDPETDAALRLRCAEKLGSLSPNGPRDAYGYLARSAKKADGITPIGVTRVLAVADGVGGVDVYVATASGGLTGTVGDLSTDLGCVDEAIQTQCVPLAITGRVHSATPLSVPVTYELWLRDGSGLTDPLVQDAVDAALLAFVTEQPIGGVVVPPAAGKIYVSALEVVIGGAVPGEIVRVVVTVPAADVVVAVTECPMLGTVLCSGIHQVASGVL
jgi:phage-related baseplate assembly protein